ncbi:peptidoglycan recognition protein family protein [Pandoraea norimbergensis]|uniref:N-acetylmuramoyl-L-alanine amidase n=1 Tax=Pandoraea norimbergensis TaxID=93219 RepID=A0ABN4JI17_9BURK|nr:peptidoglycan recognition family protein [Pandoraea norimbergensis]ALS60601.1 N-acetylmuramoyl-L-alanine amidase [Pandoraea norimbergensis]
MTDYRIEHWTSGQTVPDGTDAETISVSVNNRAATRQTIITQVRRRGMHFIERSDWAAHKARTERMQADWNYAQLAIHHAGRSFGCGPGALQLQEIQQKQMGNSIVPSDDIGYHYALDCFGNIFEGRDIRFKGEHVRRYNTGVIGIVLLENLTDDQEGNDIVSKVRGAFGTLGFKNRPRAPDRQVQSLGALVDILREYFHINTLGGHREFPGQLGDGKICPGNVGLDVVKSLRSSTGLGAP